MFISIPINFITHASPAVVWIIVFCATTLGTITAVATFTYLVFRKRKGSHSPYIDTRRRVRDVCVVLLSVSGVYISSKILKSYFAILRPNNYLYDFHSLVTANDFGFPSGHAACYSALASAIFFINHKAGITVGVIAIIIGAGRIFAGVHTPMDVLGGYVLGIGFSALVAFIMQKIEARKRKAA